MTQKIKRRKYFISKSLQSKFILRFVLTSIAGGALAVGIFNYFAHLKIDAVLFSMRFPKTSISNLLWEQMVYVNVVVVVFIVIVFIFMAKRLFARLNGPLIKLRNEVRKICDGDLTTRVVMRDKDEFKDFAAALNAMTSELQNRFAKIKGITTEMVLLVESKEQGKDQIDALRTRLSRQTDQLAKELESFQT